MPARGTRSSVLSPSLHPAEPVARIVPAYPVNLMVAGRRCLVVGGGPIALRKVIGLVEAGARVHVIAREVSTDIRALEDVTWEERPYRPGDVAGFRLAVSATDDPEVNRTVLEDAETHGVWLNSADDPENCSFTLPAVLRRGEVSIAVSTGGRSPAMAAWLRDQLATSIGPEYSVLLDLLAEAREAVRRHGLATEGLDWHRLLDSDILEVIRGGRIERARELVQAWLSSSSA
jgi:siroheme synthase-like protein